MTQWLHLLPKRPIPDKWLGNLPNEVRSSLTRMGVTPWRYCHPCRRVEWSHLVSKSTKRTAGPSRWQNHLKAVSCKSCIIRTDMLSLGWIKCRSIIQLSSIELHLSAILHLLSWNEVVWWTRGTAQDDRGWKSRREAVQVFSHDALSWLELTIYFMLSDVLLWIWN